MNIAIKPVTTISSREFNQDTAGAKKAAERGPVFITTRGEPSHVLMTKAEYDRLETLEKRPNREFRSLADALAHPESAHVDFDVPEFKRPWGLRIPDLSD